MKIWSSEDEAETRDVYPARDAERSEHSFNDNNRGDVRNRPLAYARQLEEGHLQEHDLSLAPIGVFDSGAGGLTILSALLQALPAENYIYFGDTANCPYGVRSEAEIIELTVRACDFLIGQGVKLIVVACNTASQAALNTLRATFSIPFIGVVPAVKPAARATRRGRIGIAATNQAVQAAYLQHLIEEYASGIQVYAIGCPELVTLVERGELDGPEVDATLRQALKPLQEKDVDVIVLGCTHFPALRPAIERIVGTQVQVIDSGNAIARRTQAILDTEGLTRTVSEKGLVDQEGLDRVVSTGGILKIWCSGDEQAFSVVATKILEYSVIAHQAFL